jgi:hypothetical protein
MRMRRWHIGSRPVIVLSLGHYDWTICWKPDPGRRIISIAEVLDNHRWYWVWFFGFRCLWLDYWDCYGKKQHAGGCYYTKKSLPDVLGLPAGQGWEECATNLLGGRYRVRPPIPQISSERRAYMSKMIIVVMDVKSL